MVVYEWFARISQVLAPDQKYNATVFDEPAKQDSVSLWHILAPDPNFSTTTTPDGTTNDHQHATPTMTAAPSSTPDSRTTTNNNTTAATYTYTPSPYRKQRRTDGGGGGGADTFASLQSPRSMAPVVSHPQVEQQVLRAAKDRAFHMTSPVAAIRTAGTAYRICKNSQVLKPALRQKLKEIIMQDPSILQMRSSGTAYECPDGYTLFMAATYANQIGAMEVIWECCHELDELSPPESSSHPPPPPSEAIQQLLSSRNLEGKTVFHIAAERGHIEAVEFLQAKSILVFGNDNGDGEAVNATHPPPPVDLLGHTPLGLALLSPEVQTKKNKEVFLAKLYNEQDPSIQGRSFPVDQRVVGGSSSGASSTMKHQTMTVTENRLRAVAGMSEIPGKRIRMEDCTVCQASESALILAVCDGHGDEGHISQFVAESFVTGIEEHLPALLSSPPGGETSASDPEPSSWEFVCTDLCLHIDDALYTTTSLRGGSVGVLMVVTQDNIVVANVGDCRCILVQLKQAATSTENDDDLVGQTKQLNITDDADWLNMYHVQALSTDHKPNIVSEQERIKRNGLKVVAEKVDASLTIHKIQLSDGNKLATSRAFGDFEYKANEKLDIHEQAVISIPDVVVQPRCDDDVVMIAACDGIWDVMTNEEVAMFVTQRLDQYCGTATTNDEPVDASILPKIGDELVLECLRRNSEDNMSVVIVALSNMADRVMFGGDAGELPISVPPKQLKYDSTSV